MKPENRPKIEFEGKEYDDYQATQMQRRIEAEIRKQRRIQTATEAAGLEEDAANAKIRLQVLNRKYREFSRAAGLPEQRERLKVLNAGSVSARSTSNSLANAGKSGIIKSGAISGALNPDSKQALEHAERYYQSVRSMTTDVQRISENTGYSEASIQRIKNYIFMDTHDLGDGRVSQFDASFEMAQSWQRLIDGKDIKPHDLTLLRHEIMEKELMDAGYTQDEAHIMASQKHNYQAESEKYYGNLGKNKKDR